MHYRKTNGCHEVVYSLEEIEKILTEHALKECPLPDDALQELKIRKEPARVVATLNSYTQVNPTIQDSPISLQLRWIKK